MAADITTIRPLAAPQGASSAAAAAPQASSARKVPDAAEKFEAFVLQTFIQEMMPETAEGVFGAGLAGDFWKSMMSEKIAEQVAERGSVGIANYIKVPAGLSSGGLASPAVASQLPMLGEAVEARLATHTLTGE